MRLTALVATLISALPLTAIADPAYYKVSGVASDDTLNVRAGPDGDSDDIGDLPYDATGIEIAGTDDSGTWGRIIWEEGNGWIAMRFLVPVDPDMIPETALPVGLNCHGTEPFWSMRFADSSAVYSDMSGTSLAFALGARSSAQGRAGFPVMISGTTGDQTVYSIIRPATCGDGMSDRDYPWEIDLIAGETYLSGCCNLPLEIGSH